LKIVILIIFFLLIFSSIIAVLFALLSLLRRLGRRGSGKTYKSQTRSRNRRLFFSSSKTAEYYADLRQSSSKEVKELFERGIHLKQKGKYLEAISTFEKCLDEDMTPMQRAGLLITVGNCHFAVDRLDVAKSSYEKAWYLSENSKGKSGRLACLVNMGLVSAANGEWSEAIGNYQKAIQLDRELGYSNGEAIDLNNLALIYETRGDLENALKCYNDSFLIFEKLGERKGMEIVKENIRKLEMKPAPKPD
jgi:tetratricopeptide (TPR) repeat protein